MFESIKLFRARKKVSKAIDGNLSKTEENIEQVSQIFKDFKKYKYHKHDNFLNLCLFSDIVSIDLTILLENIRLSKSKNEYYMPEYW